MRERGAAYLNRRGSSVSAANTAAQDMPETAMRLPPRRAVTTPTSMAAAPAQGDCVACMIAGNVITDSVT